MSLNLFEGKVIFRVDYDNDSWLELNGTDVVNTGQWVNVNFARSFNEPYEEEGLLDVNGKRAFGSPNHPIDFTKVPNLLNTEYYIGGVPPGFDAKNIRGLHDHFLGCIREIQIGTEARDPMQSTNYYGVEASCRTGISQVGFPGDGFVELPSHSLRRRANFGFVFRTLKSNALLMLAAYPPSALNELDSKSTIGNYSVYLSDGKINVKIDAGQGALLLTSNLTLNDGDYHVVSVTKVRKRFALRINDELQSLKRLSGTLDVVILPEEKGGLFIGGAPSEFANLAALNPFEGSIKDLVFNNRSVSFDDHIRFDNVEFGREGPDMGMHGMMVMKTEPLRRGFKEGCNRVS